MNTNKLKIGGDRVIWFIVIVLSILSLLVVYSSTASLAYTNYGGDVSHYLFMHAGILLAGFIFMFAAHLFKPEFYPRFFQLMYFLAIILLILTWMFGLDLNGAKRSLRLPLNFSFQTFEFAKFAVVGYLARVLYKNQDGFKNFKDALYKLFLPLFVVCGLMFKANLSTTLLLFVTGFVMMYVAKVKLKYLTTIILLTIATLALAIAVLSFLPPEQQGRLATWKARIENHNKPSTDINNISQAEQSKIAIATGGIIGKLPGNSTQRNFLPNPFSDFIFAIIIEEYGLIGGITVLLLYLIILYRSFRIGIYAKTGFGAYFAVGLSFMLVLQALINMAVAVGIGPTTGQPLPMVSMGGTSVLITAISIGILLSISKDTNNNAETEQLKTNE